MWKQCLLDTYFGADLTSKSEILTAGAFYMTSAPRQAQPAHSSQSCAERRMSTPHHCYLRLRPDRFCAVTEISPGKGNTKGEKEFGEKREWAHWLRERKGYPHLGKGRLYCQEHNLVITFRFRNERKEKITPKYKRRLCHII